MKVGVAVRLLLLLFLAHDTHLTAVHAATVMGDATDAGVSSPANPRSLVTEAAQALQSKTVPLVQALQAALASSDQDTQLVAALKDLAELCADGVCAYVVTGVLLLVMVLVMVVFVDSPSPCSLVEEEFRSDNGKLIKKNDGHADVVAYTVKHPTTGQDLHLIVRQFINSRELEQELAVYSVIKKGVAEGRLDQGLCSHVDVPVDVCKKEQRLVFLDKGRRLDALTQSVKTLVDITLAPRPDVPYPLGIALDPPDSGDTVKTEECVLLDVVHQADRALHCLEDAGVVHSHITPSRLVVDDAGHLTLLGVGGGTTVDNAPAFEEAGPVMYRAPEQFMSDAEFDLDPLQFATDPLQRDVFQLGVALVRAISGRFPYNTVLAVPREARKATINDELGDKANWEVGARDGFNRATDSADSVTALVSAHLRRKDRPRGNELEAQAVGSLTTAACSGAALAWKKPREEKVLEAFAKIKEQNSALVAFLRELDVGVFGQPQGEGDQ